jgi:uncharacterized protein
MRILMTGARGLIGSALTKEFRRRGDTVVPLVRREPRGTDEIQWDPNAPFAQPGKLEGFDAAIHLAGESIMGLWTPEKKRRIRESRVNGTTHLAQALAGLERPPRVVISASAIGIYGDRGDETLTEESAPGSGFLVEVSREWEAAMKPVADRADVRLAIIRIGLVLTKQGGMLQAALPAFKLGLGSTFGGGRQYFSWVTLDDLVGAVMHILDTESITGPVNIVSPEPVTSKQFTKTLARVLNRPAFLDVPAFAARALLRDMAEEMLLAGAKVLPRKLQESGYQFRHTDLEAALRQILDR